MIALRYLFLSMAAIGLCTARLLAVPFTSEYDANTYSATTGSINYVLSVPTLNGVQLPKVKAVVVSTPGIDGSRAQKVDARWVKFLYENGIAYLGVGGRLRRDESHDWDA